MEEDTESATVALAKAGDEEAFRQIVVRHAPAVFRLAYRLTGNGEEADDVVQETFLRAWKAIGRFEERSRVSSWLFRIATNHVLDTKRARTREARSEALGEDLVDSLPSKQAGPDRAAEGAEVSRRVGAAMSLLSAPERAAFVLRHCEGRSISEIAAALGIRDGAAKSAIFRAVAKLREELSPLVRVAP